MKKIEVATTISLSLTEKGEILEIFTKEFLETQNYTVKNRVRIDNAEIDLLCDPLRFFRTVS